MFGLGAIGSAPYGGLPLVFTNTNVDTTVLHSVNFADLSLSVDVFQSSNAGVFFDQFAVVASVNVSVEHTVDFAEPVTNSNLAMNDAIQFSQLVFPVDVFVTTSHTIQFRQNWKPRLPFIASGRYRR